MFPPFRSFPKFVRRLENVLPNANGQLLSLMKFPDFRAGFDLYFDLHWPFIGICLLITTGKHEYYVIVFPKVRS